MQLILQYFPELRENQISQFRQLEYLYNFWNDKINLISRTDIGNLYNHHVLHSLSIAKFCEFEPDSQILDVGTGGGFPGIPLAIMFPHVKFHLIDSIAKKVNTVRTIALDLGLQNVTTEQIRAEDVIGEFDFIVSRAVARTALLVEWTSGLISSKSRNDLPNGYILLKGGDLSLELAEVDLQSYQIPITDYFDLPFYEDKYVVYLSA